MISKKLYLITVILITAIFSVSMIPALADDISAKPSDSVSEEWLGAEPEYDPDWPSPDPLPCDGINHFDDTLVVFHEVVDAYMSEISHIDSSAFTDIRSLGVDLISDISSFLSFINHNKIRLALSGSIYRTAIKKAVDNFILNKKVEFEESDIFQYIYSFCLGNRMIQRKGDRNLSLTVKGKAWDHQPLERKLFRLLSFAFEEWESGEDQFHLPALKKMFVDSIKGLEINCWYDVMLLPFKCRNYYLANLENNNVRDAFQNRYQYTQNTSMRDSVQLAHSLFNWLRNRFYLLGLVDLGFVDGKVAALRLTPLGAKALGMALPDEAEVAQNPLIVNPEDAQPRDSSDRLSGGRRR